MNPDIVLLHIGTNDVVMSGYSATNSVDNIKSIISVIRGVDTNTDFFVAQVIPLPAHSSKIAELNAEIALEIPNLFTDESQVTVVDMQSEFDTNWLWDGVHPDNDGDHFIADQWYAAIPEPSCLSLFCLGVMYIIAGRRNKK